MFPIIEVNASRINSQLFLPSEYIVDCLRRNVDQNYSCAVYSKQRYLFSCLSTHWTRLNIDAYTKASTVTRMVTTTAPLKVISEIIIQALIR